MKRSPQTNNQPAARAARATGSLEPVRARAQLTRAALLKSGRELLETHDLQAMSVAAIAAATGLSVGSFYGRFKDKEAFFETLQREITAEWIDEARRTLECGDCQGLTATALVDRICKLVVQLIRQDAGFLRAALKHEATSPGAWTPIKQAGKEVAALAVAVLQPALPPGAQASNVARIRFALQVVYSTCFNGILHDPGPIPVASSRLARELGRMMCLYLCLPDDTPPSAARAPKPRVVRASTQPAKRHPLQEKS